MGAQTLSTLLSGMPLGKVRGDLDTPITGISYDSRTVEPGYAFFAIQGQHTDGHKYIDDAIRAGAAAIVHSRRVSAARETIPFVQTSSVRRLLSAASAAFFGHPSRALYCIGVTGTDGKSTTTYMIYQLLRSLGAAAGFMSTVFVDTGTGVRKNPLRQSTPESPEVHQILADMRDNGLTHAVIEATSHGLSEKTCRLEDVFWKGAVFTNLSHEHLEFHGSFERYRQDKARLFAALDRQVDTGAWGDFGVVNVDDLNAHVFQNATARRLYTYSAAGNPADIRAHRIETNGGGSRFDVEVEGTRFDARLSFPGEFNVANALAALAAAHRASGEPWEKVGARLGHLTPLPGRMQRIDEGQGFDIIVDFAHTPASFESVIPGVRSRTAGRLIVVFGSAGERDRGKRKLQGQVADRFADTIILTDEDPRGEPPQRILEEIAAGCRAHRRDIDLHLIPDRREAIMRALKLATAGDSVLLLGKGHETGIIYADRTIEWNEAQVARTILHDMGYRHD